MNAIKAGSDFRASLSPLLKVCVNCTITLTPEFVLKYVCLQTSTISRMAWPMQVRRPQSTTQFDDRINATHGKILVVLSFLGIGTHSLSDKYVLNKQQMAEKYANTLMGMANCREAQYSTCRARVIDFKQGSAALSLSELIERDSKVICDTLDGIGQDSKATVLFHGYSAGCIRAFKAMQRFHGSDKFDFKCCIENAYVSFEKVLMSGFLRLTILNFLLLKFENNINPIAQCLLSFSLVPMDFILSFYLLLSLKINGRDFQESLADTIVGSGLKSNIMMDTMPQNSMQLKKEGQYFGMDKFDGSIAYLHGFYSQCATIPDCKLLEDNSHPLMNRIEAIVELLLSSDTNALICQLSEDALFQDAKLNLSC